MGSSLFIPSSRPQKRKETCHLDSHLVSNWMLGHTGYCLHKKYGPAKGSAAHCLSFLKSFDFLSFLNSLIITCTLFGWFSSSHYPLSSFPLKFFFPKCPLLLWHLFFFFDPLSLTMAACMSMSKGVIYQNIGTLSMVTSLKTMTLSPSPH